MKFMLLLLCVFIFGCSQKVTLSDEQYAAQLAFEMPSWLVSDSNCPADLFPGKPVKFSLSLEYCEGNLERCIKRCAEGEASYCHASAYAAQTLETKIYPSLFAKACSLGVASGCTNSGAYLFNQADRIGDMCIARTFEIACDAGDMWGCTMTAVLLSTGNGVERNWQRASDLMYQVCEETGNESEQCTYGLGVVEGAKFIGED